MREVGIRDLKANLSSLLHRVEEGESIRVTTRGRPVAEVVPMGSRRTDARLRTLVAEGRVTPPARERPRRPPRRSAKGRSASAIVLAERDDER